MDIDLSLTSVPPEIIELIADLLPDAESVMSLTRLNKRINEYLYHKIHYLKKKCYDQQCYYFSKLVRSCEEYGDAENSDDQEYDSSDDCFWWRYTKSKTISCPFSRYHELSVVYDHTSNNNNLITLYLDERRVDRMLTLNLSDLIKLKNTIR